MCDFMFKNILTRVYIIEYSNVYLQIYIYMYKKYIKEIDSDMSTLYTIAWLRLLKTIYVEAII